MSDTLTRAMLLEIIGRTRETATAVSAQCIENLRTNEGALMAVADLFFCLSRAVAARDDGVLLDRVMFTNAQTCVRIVLSLVGEAEAAAQKEASK